MPIHCKLLERGLQCLENLSRHQEQDFSRALHPLISHLINQKIADHVELDN
ncbi:Uncharacterised protein [Chlamydia trachomatis]|nr:Uncharacterised protein [Chlamydia trachomatis]